MSLPTTFKLNTGASVPSVAFGTYGAEDEEIFNAVTAALKAGYRHIDAAYFYQNEKPVGRAIRESGIPRKDIFVCTKMWPTQAADPKKALEGSLEALGLDYVDLYLMHWPVAVVPNPKEEFSWGLGLDKSLDFVQIWEEFQKLPEDKVKAIGVSNFTSVKLDKLLSAPTTKVVPATNQCEFHPNLPQQKLVDYCKEKGIVCEAYCPLARGQLDNPIIVEIAKNHGIDAGQVVLSWNVQRGVVVLPKSVTPSRIASNLKVSKLSDDEMEKISSIGKNSWSRISDPSKHLGGMDVYDGDVDCK